MPTDVIAAQFTQLHAADNYTVTALELLVAGRNREREDRWRENVIRVTERFRKLNKLGGGSVCMYYVYGYLFFYFVHRTTFFVLTQRVIFYTSAG
jgi:hypothetical protein